MKKAINQVQMSDYPHRSGQTVNKIFTMYVKSGPDIHPALNHNK